MGWCFFEYNSWGNRIQPIRRCITNPKIKKTITRAPDPLEAVDSPLADVILSSSILMGTPSPWVVNTSHRLFHPMSMPKSGSG
jgi:hypothetical protein